MIHISPIFAFLFALAVLCAILAYTLMLVVLGTVNRQLPDNEQIPHFWWSMKKVRQQYRKFNPGGRLLALVPAFGIRMIVFFLASTFFRRCDGSCSSSAARKEARPAKATTYRDSAVLAHTANPQARKSLRGSACSRGRRRPLLTNIFFLTYRMFFDGMRA